MSKRLYSIGETAKFLGVSIDTLRLWDKKNILLSFRPSPESKRYYRKEDIDNFLAKDKQPYEGDLASMAKDWAFAELPTTIHSSLYCETSDIFSARLQRFGLELSRIPELKDIFSLVVAIAGEIGNNSYNHNIGNWPDMSGVLFAYNIQNRQVVLADRGQGILKTLKRVIPELSNDHEALNTAFTEYVSGRAPENRGNGLKFVKDVVLSNPISLQFYSGDAQLVLTENASEFNIEDSNTSFHGCVAIINY